VTTDDPTLHRNPDSQVAREPVSSRMRRVVQRVFLFFREYFVLEAPSLGAAILPFSLLSVVLYTRHPVETNFIFDEQEALLANPYVRSVMGTAEAAQKYRWLDAFKTDFWGRAPELTIGSYRPLPNLIWRAAWWVTCSLQKLSPNPLRQSPFFCHWVNVLLHGINGALVTAIAYALTRRRDIAWISGAIFTASAILTEAVSGVVGLSDVLSGMGALLAVYALTLPAHIMPMGVFLGAMLGLFSKESALCCVPLVPLGALLTAQIMHQKQPRRWLRAALSLAATALAFVLYVQLRKRLFHTPTPAEFLPEAVANKGRSAKLFAAILRWYAQPGLPKDALNNPLVNADTAHRVAGALRVYTRGLGQIVLPLRLSGDYSSPQEPIPERLVFFESVVGALAMIVPLLLVPILGVRAYLRRSRDRYARTPQLGPVIAFASVWVVVSFFPVSNIPIILPTVRAERFWYFPVFGTSILLGIVIAYALQRALHSAASNRQAPNTPEDPDDPDAPGSFATSAPAASAATILRHLPKALGVALVAMFAMIQIVSARRHANDYYDDLRFWESTQYAVPNSAKAHLNYSVMLGARSLMKERLVANQRALELEPKWAMANVYLGDTLCRMHRPTEAIPHYLEGFELDPNGVSLIALALQCLWDEKELTQDNDLMHDLDSRSTEHPGSWFEYLVRDLKENGEKNKGVETKHRPRSYNEGPKD
jgi:protein O-mannosyl-transferase